MKQFAQLITAVAVFAFSGFASATPITDPFNPTPVTVTAATPLNFLHDFTDNGYVAGFDTITWAELTIYLKDMGKNQGGTESFILKIDHDGSTLLTGSNVDNGVTPFAHLSIVSAPLQELSANGKLWFTLSAGTGDFQFVSSVLDAEYTPGVAPVDVPEPLSVALVGIGLAAIGAARRKA